MYGPLNGVRVALVAAALVAAVVGLILGHLIVGSVLLAGVAVHGLGWIYLYRQGTRSTADPLRQLHRD